MTDRQAMIRAIVNELRLYAAHSQHIGHAYAARNDLGKADLPALMLIMEADRAGEPVTPGRLREELNFSSGSVTGLIDRLEAAGHVYRDRDTADRRKIFLRYAEPAAAVAQRFFGPLARRTEEVLDGFSDTELATIQRFLDAMVVTMQEHRADIQTGGPP